LVTGLLGTVLNVLPLGQLVGVITDLLTTLLAVVDALLAAILNILPNLPISGLLDLVNGIESQLQTLVNQALAQVGSLLGVVGAIAQDLDLSALAGCAAKNATACGLIDLSLNCSNSCTSTNICVNVCTSLLDGVTTLLTNQCVCEQGAYMNEEGLCIALNLCTAGTGIGK
jgi:hypothetical protein